MRQRPLPFCGIIVLLLLFSIPFFGETANVKKVDKKADQLMHGMDQLLSSATNISFHTTEVHYRLGVEGKLMEGHAARDVLLQRPRGMWFHMTADPPEQNREVSVWYDGKTLTVQSDKQKVFARMAVPPTLDEALDYAAQTLNFPMPVADMFYSSPYESFMSEDTTGGYVNTEKIGNRFCHQLAFQQEVVDWRIWIADGERPLPCQLEITYKLNEGKPKSRITFQDWNLEAAIPDGAFVHQPPVEYREIPMIQANPAQQPETQTQEEQQ